MTSDIRDELRGVARLLRHYGNDQRADFLDRLAADSDDRMLAVASGLELWGGAGACVGG